ncbi:MAG: tol-pal system-associated acyl-CoA thioesterase [Gammaproteobacteria bacterium]|nr:tol-pal system-associated acyl-CoA thioesterase [Gammaproteobacteria bacterium]
MRQFTSAVFTWPVRVYYEDTDAAGLVYYANYLKYLERARTEFLRALGFEQDALRREHGVVFVVRKLTIDYLAAARFNEMLSATVQIDRARRASIDFLQTVTHAGELCCSAEVKVACLDLAVRRPCAIPKAITEELTT